MKKILTLALVVVIMALTALPALAQGRDTAPNGELGISKALVNPGSLHRSDVAVEKLTKNLEKFSE